MCLLKMVLNFYENVWRKTKRFIIYMNLQVYFFSYHAPHLIANHEKYFKLISLCIASEITQYFIYEAGDFSWRFQLFLSLKNTHCMAISSLWEYEKEMHLRYGVYEEVNNCILLERLKFLFITFGVFYSMKTSTL